MTVAAAVAAVTHAGPEGKHGSYVDADEEYHHRETMLLLLLLPRHATAARPVLLLLLLPRYATAARPVLLLLMLLPQHATVAKYHIVVPSLLSASPAPPVPKPTADDKNMRVRGCRRRTCRRSLFRNFVGLALGVGGTDGVF